MARPSARDEVPTAAPARSATRLEFRKPPVAQPVRHPGGARLQPTAAGIAVEDIGALRAHRSGRAEGPPLATHAAAVPTCAVAAGAVPTGSVGERQARVPPPDACATPYLTTGNACPNDRSTASADPAAAGSALAPGEYQPKRTAEP